MSGKTTDPLVNIIMGPLAIQVEPEKAREIAMMMLDCAAAAECDAALYEFAAKDHPGAGSQLVSIVRGFRARRLERRE